MMFTLVVILVGRTVSMADFETAKDCATAEKVIIEMFGETGHGDPRNLLTSCVRKR